MEVLMKNKILLFTFLLLCFGSCLYCTCVSKAASQKITKLKENKLYSIDLNSDGVAEKIKYSLINTKDTSYKYKIYINGKIAYTKKLECSYNPGLYIADFDKKDGVKDLWAFSWGESDDIIYSSHLQYKNHTVKKICDFDYKEIGKAFNIRSGILHSTDGKGHFSVCFDRSFYVDNLIGNHYDIVPFTYKNGKDKLQNVSTYKIKSIINKNNILTLKEEISFLSKPKIPSSISMKLKRGKKVKPTKIYYKKDQLFVQFKSDSGQTGWIYANPYCYSFSNDPMQSPFSDILLAD